MNKGIINDKLNEFLPETLLVIILLMITCTILMFNVVKKITHPLKQLTEFTEDLERYQFDTSKINQDKMNKIISLDDEIGEFSKRYMPLQINKLY